MPGEGSIDSKTTTARAREKSYESGAGASSLSWVLVGGEAGLATVPIWVWGGKEAARDEAATGHAWREDEVVACSAVQEQDSISSCHGRSLGKSSGVMYLIPAHARAPRP